MIIGLSGYARSGKDTVAKYLVENHGFVRVAFADTLRNILSELNPILEDGHRLNEAVKMYGWDITKSKYDEVRRLLQVLGVAGRELIAEDVWIGAALKTPTNGAPVVISDVRFKNEADVIKKLGGSIWRVVRPDTAPVNSHVSEVQMNYYSFDELIMNDKDIRHLENEVLLRMPIRL